MPLVLKMKELRDPSVPSCKDLDPASDLKELRVDPFQRPQEEPA